MPIDFDHLQNRLKKIASEDPFPPWNEQETCGRFCAPDCPGGAGNHGMDSPKTKHYNPTNQIWQDSPVENLPKGYPPGGSFDAKNRGEKTIPF